MKTRSKKAKKQRKFIYNAPLHLRRKILSGHLSKELKKEYGKRSFPIRKGDEVKIMRGEFKGREGKVMRVDYKKYRVYIEGITKKRAVGTEYNVPIHPSNLTIIKLNLGDKKRLEALRRK